MTTIAVLFAGSLFFRWMFLGMTWCEDRARRQMLRELARIKHKHRSRAPGGSAQTGGARSPNIRRRLNWTGVEHNTLAAPPVPPSLVGAGDSRIGAAPARLPIPALTMFEGWRP